MESLLNALSFGGILPRENVDYIVSHFEERTLASYDHFLSIGEVAHEVSFVASGILRAYALDKDGSEVTKYFIRPGQFGVDLESYYALKPATSAIQAAVPTTLFVIHRRVWNKLSEEIPKLYILTKNLTEATLLNKIKDNDFLNFGTAVEKYHEFLKLYPDVARLVPQQFIASYLKIAPQSLSRIRKDLATKDSVRKTQQK